MLPVNRHYLASHSEHIRNTLEHKEHIRNTLFRFGMLPENRPWSFPCQGPRSWGTHEGQWPRSRKTLECQRPWSRGTHECQKRSWTNLLRRRGAGSTVDSWPNVNCWPRPHLLPKQKGQNKREGLRGLEYQQQHIGNTLATHWQHVSNTCKGKDSNSSSLARFFR
jgi:hypothetical protein